MLEEDSCLSRDGMTDVAGGTGNGVWSGQEGAGILNRLLPIRRVFADGLRARDADESLWYAGAGPGVGGSEREGDGR